MPFVSLADANQCMRVSSALEAGTVSDLVEMLVGHTVIRLILALLP